MVHTNMVRRGAWGAQFVKSPTLDLGSCLDQTGFSVPGVGLLAGCEAKKETRYEDLVDRKLCSRQHEDKDSTHFLILHSREVGYCLYIFCFWFNKCV